MGRDLIIGKPRRSRNKPRACELCAEPGARSPDGPWLCSKHRNILHFMIQANEAGQSTLMANQDFVHCAGAACGRLVRRDPENPKAKAWCRVCYPTYGPGHARRAREKRAKLRKRERDRARRARLKAAKAASL